MVVFWLFMFLSLAVIVITTVDYYKFNGKVDVFKDQIEIIHVRHEYNFKGLEEILGNRGDEDTYAN